MFFGNDWDKILENEFKADYYVGLKEKLIFEYSNYVVYPKSSDIFNAFKLTSYSDTKVVILGQDPYHNFGEAEGLCFSVPDDIKMPPSLKNIYAELESDLQIVRKTSSLKDWAKQGVFLLNTTLTVRENMPNSHKDLGWSEFTDSVICKLNQKAVPIVFILWGNNAIAKQVLITNPIHKILKSPHPSPLSCYRGFFGSKPFSKTNKFLLESGQATIKW